MKSGPIQIIRTRIHNNSGPIFNRFWEIDWVRFLSKIGLDRFSGREGAGGGGGHSKAPISLEEGVGREQGGKRYIF